MMSGLDVESHLVKANAVRVLVAIYQRVSQALMIGPARDHRRG